MRVLNAGELEIVSTHNDEATIVHIARVCTGTQKYIKNDLEDYKLLHSLYKRGHHSVFEHVGITLEVKMPIFVARQWVRHRIGWSWTEKSLRYCEADDLEFWYPYVDEVSREVYSSYISSYEHVKRHYAALRRDGVKKQEARTVLPVGVYTDVVMTTNLRAVDHFLKLRLCRQAQPQTRAYACLLLYELREEFPDWSSVWEYENMLLIDSAKKDKVRINEHTYFN